MYGQFVFFISLLVAFFLSIPTYAELSAYQIVEKAYNIEDGNDLQAVMVMKIVKSGSVKKRELFFYRKDYGKDNRTLIIFQSPADVKGTAFLTWNNLNKDNDQWLYLPALKKVSRIAVSSKAKSFMGSEFSYEDLSKRNINSDTFKILKDDVTLGSEPCFLVEALSKDKNDKYTKRIFWIRKDNFVIIRSDIYDNSGKLVKRYTVEKVEKMDNIWTLFSCKMENLESKNYSILELSKVKYNSGLSDRFFRVQDLKR